MVASAKTTKNVRDIVLKHMSREEALAMIAELKEVRGNKSFRETILLLEKNVSEAEGDFT